jgi:ferredoxin-thioredoxin reductase catalytic subunit
MGLMFGIDGSEVRVTEVVLTALRERTTTYRVTFSCGCRYVEERENSVPCRAVDDKANCYADHRVEFDHALAPMW